MIRFGDIYAPLQKALNNDRWSGNTDNILSSFFGIEILEKKTRTIHNGTDGKREYEYIFKYTLDNEKQEYKMVVRSNIYHSEKEKHDEIIGAELFKEGVDNG